MSPVQPNRFPDDQPFGPKASSLQNEALADSLRVLEIINEAAVLLGADREILDATSSFCRIMGCAVPELRGRDIREIIEGLPLDPYHPAEGDLIKSVEGPLREFHSFEPLSVHNAQGEDCWVVPHVTPVSRKDSKAPERMLILQDVSALMQARMEALESERKYRELVEHANSMILRVDNEFRILFVNEYALNFFGYEAASLLESSLLDFLVPETGRDGANQHAVVRRAVRQPELFGNYDLLTRCRDGRLAWVHWSVRALRDERGLVRELLCVGVDITQRKAAEIEADRYRRRARHFADQLINTEEKERFRMAGYLHDHIIQMLSLSNIRLGEALAGLRQARIPEVEEQIHSVRTILDTATGSCRSMMDQLAPVLLHELGVGAALRHCAEQLRQSGDVEVDIDDQLQEKSLSRPLASLLFRSLRELMMNAFKYAGSCSIHVRLWTEQERIVAEVRDDGEGFDVGMLEEGGYDRHGGFGLFTIRERVESLGGLFRIDSSPGNGTTATLSIPHA